MQSDEDVLPFFYYAYELHIKYLTEKSDNKCHRNHRAALEKIQRLSQGWYFIPQLLLNSTERVLGQETEVM